MDEVEYDLLYLDCGSQGSSVSVLGTYHALHIFFFNFAIIISLGGTSDGQHHKNQQKISQEV